MSTQMEIPAIEVNTAFVLRSNATEFSLALKNTLTKLNSYEIMDITYSTYYDATRKRPVYTALILFKVTDGLQDLNEDGSQQQQECHHHHKDGNVEYHEHHYHHHHHDDERPAPPPHHHHHHHPLPPPPIQWLDIEDAADQPQSGNTENQENKENQENGGCSCCTIQP